MRTSGGAEWISPITRATAASGLQVSGSRSLPSKPRIRNLPKRVGKSASARLAAWLDGLFWELTIRLYVPQLPLRHRLALGCVSPTRLYWLQRGPTTYPHNAPHPPRRGRRHRQCSRSFALFQVSVVSQRSPHHQTENSP